MKPLILIILFVFGIQANAMQVIDPNEDCTSQIVKSSSNKNGIVKNKNGAIVTNNETMSLEIDPCNDTVLLELNKKTYDLVLYKTNESGTIHAATLDGKQIIKINVNSNIQEIETQIDDLIFITYINTNIVDTRPIAVDD